MTNEIAKIKEEFKVIEKRFTDLTDVETFAKECSFALQHFNKNKYLASATMDSKREAVLNVAQVGLTLNPVLKLAYLVPRKANINGNWVVQCHLEPSYQGLVKLITDTGSATTVYSHCVYEGDEFEVSLGTSTNIKHIPKHNSTVITHAYAVALLPDKTMQVDVMPIAEIHEIRNGSESYKAYVKNPKMSCIWVKFEGEMSKKTVTKRLVKYLPKTDRWDKISTAIELTNQDFKCSVGQIIMIESLLMNANIEDSEKAKIECDVTEYSSQQATNTIQWLQENQVNPITHGGNATQTEIGEEVKAIANEK